MNALVEFSLRHRLLVLCLAVITLVVGGYQMGQLPIDIFPSLTRPRVTLMTECPGLSPEEVESLVTKPLETAFNGATGVEAVRSQSGVGLSVIYVEFGWKTDIRVARQVVTERLASTQANLPEGVHSELAPISSIMGQILIVGMHSKEGKTSPLEVRTLADWVVRQRVLAVPGVAQVITMGGGRRQVQVHVDPQKLRAFDVTLAEVESALRESNQNSSGGYVNSGSQEFLVRSLGRAASADEIGQTVVKRGTDRAVLVRDIATIQDGAQIKRGDSSVNGQPAVVLTINKQPDADTRIVTKRVQAALEDLKRSLPEDVVLEPHLYEQREFIDLGIDNVMEALRDGAILVVLVLIPILMNVRVTFITLTAIPLSIVIAGLVFSLLGLSVNVMTLGGLAVAMGELVDDAIVDIENVFRRLKQNAALEHPKSVLQVVYEASVEVRNSLVFGTMLVILVFLPLFSLSGVEGRLFMPLGIAYIVSILASLLVSVTVTPVLGVILLGKMKGGEHDHAEHQDGFLLRLLKRMATPVIRLSCMRTSQVVLLSAVVASIGFAGWLVTQIGTDFLPPFDEGAAQVNVVVPPGTSLEASNRLATIVDQRMAAFRQTEENPKGLIRSFVRRTGRAEMDEHAEGVNVSEIIVTMNPDSGLSRSESLAQLRKELEEVPGIEYEVEQPLAHLISHMLSGVSAQIAIKIYGEDLDILRAKAQEVKSAIQEVKGIAPPVVEPQQLIPQWRIELDREKLAMYQITPGYVNSLIQTALQGRVVSSVLEGGRSFDLVVRLKDEVREDLHHLDRLAISMPDGSQIPLKNIAKLYEGAGPNTISREEVQRRITIRVNTTDRDLGSVVADIRQQVEAKVKFPTGYSVKYGGQFEAQQEATRQMAILSVVSFLGVFLVLFTLYPSVRIVLQIMLALPIAFVGGVIALKLTGQSLSVASMVGFISLGGIAARNGILLVSHYLHLMKEEGESFSEAMIMRGSLERLAPVLMTALTAGIGLVPLVIGGHQPGKEILYPVATVILGGLVTSTFCEYVVHPGLFLRFSGSDAKRLAGAASDADEVIVAE